MDKNLRMWNNIRNFAECTAALRAPTYSAVWSLFLYASNIHKTTKKNEEADNP